MYKCPTTFEIYKPYVNRPWIAARRYIDELSLDIDKKYFQPNVWKGPNKGYDSGKIKCAHFVSELQRIAYSC